MPIEMPIEEQSYGQTLRMRRSHIGQSCKLHFEAAPLKIVRASKQYMYDEGGTEFLDCINNVSHVGHCHPYVVSVAQEQMAKLSTSSGFLSDSSSQYAKQLVGTFPESLNICYFVNSGSEANDLALRLAQAHTKQKDLLVVENAYHGNLSNLIDISHSRFKKMPGGKKEHVHVVPWPNTYRGLFREDHANLGEAYALEVKKKIQAVHKEGRQIAGFICEPLMSTAGVITPPQNYLKHVYKLVREAGGVCIADEVQVGLGRVGDYYWSFQSYDVVPDIVTCGKPMGNGFPMAAVVTTTEVANSLACFESSFGGNPVSCSVGLAVLDVIQNEKLLSSAKCVGLVLLEGFRNIQPNHPMMGDVRGQGLIIGVELVTDKESRKPASEAAELLTYKAKQLRILVANEGPDKNVIVMTPPLCFNIDNARHVIQVIDKVLAEIERGTCPDQMSAQSDEGITELTIPLDIVSGVESYDDDDDDPHCKRARYEDMD